MLETIKLLIEKLRIKRLFKNDKYILLFEGYLSGVFLKLGEVESILLGKLHSDECNINSIGKYQISKKKLLEIAKIYEEEQKHNSNLTQEKELKNFLSMNIEEFDQLISERFPEYFMEATRQCYKYNNIWRETDPVIPAIVFLIDYIMAKNNCVHIKKFTSRKCDLIVKRVVIDDYTWRLDFYGKWIVDREPYMKGIFNPDINP